VVTVNDLLQPELYCHRRQAMLPPTFLTGFATGMLITTLVQTDDIVASRSFALAGLDAPGQNLMGRIRYYQRSETTHTLS